MADVFRRPTRKVAARVDGGAILASFPGAARVVQVEGPAAWGLNPLWGHREDLRFCAATLERLMAVRLAESGSADLEAALWEAAVVRFYRCFTRLKGSGALPIDAAGGRGGRGSDFRRLQEARERIVKLNRMSVRRFGTAVVEDDAGRVLGAFPVGTDARPDLEDCRALARLIEATARRVRNRISEECQELPEGLERGKGQFPAKVLWRRPAA